MVVNYIGGRFRYAFRLWMKIERMGDSRLIKKIDRLGKTVIGE